MALQQRSLPWGLLFFFTSLNWKSRENESRHPHMEWAIGLTLTCPQIAKWKNSFIYVMWTEIVLEVSMGVDAKRNFGWNIRMFFFLFFFLSFLIFFSRFIQVIFVSIWQRKFNVIHLISIETAIPCASWWFH